jgi:hypothetical protein
VTDDPLGLCCGHAKSAHSSGKRCIVTALLGAVAVPCGCKKFRAVPEPERQIELVSAIGVNQ